METKQHYEIPAVVTVEIKSEGVICGSQYPLVEPTEEIMDRIYYPGTEI